MSRLALLLLATLLGGCSMISGSLVGTDNAEPPAKLQPVATEVGATVLWQVDAGQGVGDLGHPLAVLVAGDRVVTTDYRGRLSSFDQATGDRLWSVETGLPVTGGPGGDAEHVSIGTSEGTVVAFDAATGAELWRRQVSSEVLAAPRFGGDVVLVRSIDGRLSALNLGDGALRWFYDGSVPTLSLRGTSAPVIDGATAFAGFASGRLAALSLHDGRLEWEASVAYASGRSELDRLVDIDGDPVVLGDTVYAATYQGRIVALDRRDGSLVWSSEISTQKDLAADGRHLFVSDEQSQLWAIDRDSGAALWRQDALLYRELTAPVVVGGRLVVGDLEGYLHLFAIEDGHAVGRIRVGRKPILATLRVQGDTIYVVDSAGRLSAVSFGSGG